MRKLLIPLLATFALPTAFMEGPSLKQVLFVFIQEMFMHATAILHMTMF